MTPEFQNPEIPTIPSSADMPDLAQFDGARVKIEGWEIVEMKSQYDPITNEKLSDPVMVKKLKVLTEPLAQGTKKDGTKFDIRASALFKLQLKDGVWGLSPHPKAKIQGFFRKLKINSLPEMKGKFVTITLTEDNFLRIVVE